MKRHVVKKLLKEAIRDVLSNNIPFDKWWQKEGHKISDIRTCANKSWYDGYTKGHIDATQDSAIKPSIKEYSTSTDADQDTALILARKIWGDKVYNVEIAKSNARDKVYGVRMDSPNGPTHAIKKTHTGQWFMFQASGDLTSGSSQSWVPVDNATLQSTKQDTKPNPGVEKPNIAKSWEPSSLGKLKMKEGKRRK